MISVKMFCISKIKTLVLVDNLDHTMVVMVENR